ncbi:MAG TPA: T9SS type A sorting domain-containing protein, partial [Chitinophagaceae bacterium]|nr:T9SS type A sorting domain-containing protein [Chitinophagaceae bacterium]
IAAVVSQYPSDATKALLTYNISSAPAGAFPLIVEVYTDLGIAAQWDVSDVLIDTRSITDASAGNQYIILPNWDVAVIIVVKSASDCYNKTLPVGNYWSVLPVQLVSFQGNVNSKNKVSLQWRVENNKTVDQFEVQRSHDGREFKTVGIVFASEKTDIEDYMFYETISSFEKVMYRLKMIDKNDNISYSKTLAFQNKAVTTNKIKIFNNPVVDQLTFNYTAFASRIIDIKIYDMSGRVMLANKVNSLEGNNMITFPLASTIKASMYLVEVSNGSDIQTAKFVKQ